VGSLLLTGLLAGCGDDSGSSSATTSVEAGYCDAWAQVGEAFAGYDQIDLVNGGLDSVRAYLDELDASLEELSAAAGSLLQPRIDAFTTSLSDLVTTLTSPSLPVDRRTQVQEARDQVQRSWDDLVSTVGTSCPDVSVPEGS
jgi:hypothetical protein